MKSRPQYCALSFAALSLACGSAYYTNPSTDGGTWVNATENLAGMPSECGNMGVIASRPDRDLLVTGVALHGLWASENGARSWSPLGQGSGSAVITNRISMFVFDPQSPDQFWESGIYNGGAVYKTVDNGATFVQLGSISHSDMVSVDLSDPNRSTLLAGGHEQSGTVYRSTDAGATWMNVGSSLPPGAGNSSYPLAIDSQVHLLGTWGSAGAGIFRTVNGGSSWSIVSPGAVRSRPLVASDGTIYWLLAEDAGIVRSADKGQTWTRIALPGVLATSRGEGGWLTELPDHRLVSLGSAYVLLSADRGATWTAVGPVLPFPPVGVVYSTFRNAFYVWYFGCKKTIPDPVPDDAIMRFDFDYRTR